MGAIFCNWEKCSENGEGVLHERTSKYEEARFRSVFVGRGSLMRQRESGGDKL